MNLSLRHLAPEGFGSDNGVASRISFLCRVEAAFVTPEDRISTPLLRPQASSNPQAPCPRVGRLKRPPTRCRSCGGGCAVASFWSRCRFESPGRRLAASSPKLSATDARQADDAGRASLRPGNRRCTELRQEKSRIGPMYGLE